VKIIGLVEERELIQHPKVLEFLQDYLEGPLETCGVWTA